MKSYVRAGIALLVEHPQLWFVVVQGFLLPALFIYTANSFFSIAHQNIETSEKRRIASLHTVIESDLHTSPLPSDALNATLYVDDNIVSKQIVVRQDENFIVVAASDKALIGTIVSTPESFQTAYARPGETIIFEISSNGERRWQAFRASVDTQNNLEYVIYTEHSFAQIDTVLTQRAQTGYIVITFILVYVIATAIWLARQIDWQNRYQTLEHELYLRDQFTNMIVHELRTPLTAIRGYASLLSESTQLDVQHKSYVSHITHSSDRLVRLISDFLEVARLQAGKITPAKISTDIRTTIDAVVGELTATAKEKSLQIIVNHTEDSLNLITDPDRLQQVLVNLVANALKYTQKGTVTITTKLSDHTVEIRIADTGRGIAGADQQKLFAPFSRVGDTSSVTGTGLGLWIARELTNLLGGSLTIESIADVGTHSVLTFPYSK